ncbi:MAG: ferritin [Akkermansiaceae bacterium]|nr:ferritin [Akkermansiaceae bacterium]
MNPEIAEALHEQIHKEFTAAFLYLSFSVQMREYGLRGAGKWLRVQYREECGHALRLLDYLDRRRVPAHVPRIDTPDYTWETPLDVFRLALEHEQQITQSIHTLASLCYREQDYATLAELTDYITEQVEEENQVADIVAALKRCGNDASALFQLDLRLENARDAGEKVWAQ